MRPHTASNANECLDTEGTLSTLQRTSIHQETQSFENSARCEVAPATGHIYGQVIVNGGSVVNGNYIVNNSGTEELKQLVLDSLHVAQSIKQELQGDRQQKVLDWLSTFSSMQKHQDVKAVRLDDTGSWLIQDERFREWNEGESSNALLWCKGIPGAGKTVLTSLVIDHLMQRQQERGESVVYHYCDYRDENTQDPSKIWASLVRQLAMPISRVPQQLQKLYNKCSSSRRSPDVKELVSCFLEISASMSRVYIVIDALDECESVKYRSRLLETIKGLKLPSMRVFMTSRDHPEDIKRSLRDATQIVVEAHKCDIERFLSYRIEEEMDLEDLVDHEMKAEIISTIASAAEGMFLLPALQIQTVIDQTTRNEIHEALSSLPGGLHNTFRATVDRIGRLPSSKSQLAMKTLMWITRAQRPLSVAAIRHALAIRGHEAALIHDNLSPTKFLTELCMGLVAINEESSTVTLVHQSLQEFFAANEFVLFPMADKLIAEACLCYLAFDAFIGGPCPDDSSYRAFTDEHALLVYAAKEWGRHLCRASTVDDRTVSRAIDLLSNGKRLLLLSQVMHTSVVPYLGYSQHYPRSVTGLHLVAFFGLGQLTQNLLSSQRHYRDRLETAYFIKKGSLPPSFANVVDSNNATPLSWACENGHHDVVKILLDYGAKADVISATGPTPLTRAAYNGHVDIVKTLIDAGAHLECRDWSRSTALTLAAQQKHVGIVSQLTEAGANLDSRDGDDPTPLWYAADRGHLDVVKVLIARGADIESREWSRSTPLHLAAKKGNLEMVTYLLDHGADIEAKDGFGLSSLAWAADGAHLAVAALLLDRGACLASDDGEGQTPLCWAARSGSLDMVQMLHKRGANIDPKKGMYFMTPLSWAEERQHHTVWNYLQAEEARLHPEVTTVKGSSEIPSAIHVEFVEVNAHC